MRTCCAFAEILSIIASLLVAEFDYASTVVGSGTRVATFEISDQSRIGAERSPNADICSGELASGSLLAPRGGRGAPDFVVTPKGEAIPVPSGATGPTPTRAPGVQYTGGSGGHGLDSRVPVSASWRVMQTRDLGPCT